jgi:RNA polymerase sigma-70 factor (ECF subfamily)
MAEVSEFEKIYIHYWSKVYRLCMGYANNDAIARDLTQESFILIWENLSKFREEADLGTWIFRIASNHCLRQVEKGKRMQSVELPFQIEDEPEPDKSRELELLQLFISELPETDRIVISLELEEIKQSEIAKIVGLSEGNIRVKIHRIKERLTQRFKENGY